MTDGVRYKANSVEGAAANVSDLARQNDNESMTTSANEEERSSAVEHEEKSSTIHHEEKSSTVAHEDGRQKEVLPVEAPVVGVEGVVEGSEQNAETAPAVVEPIPHTEKTLPVTEGASGEIQEHHTPKDEKEAEASAEVAGENEGDETGIVYPSGTKLVLLTFGLCMAVFVVALVSPYSKRPTIDSLNGT